MFWGLVIEPGKRYYRTVVNPFHISAAVLDTSISVDELVRVIVDVDGNELILANLSLKHGILQSPLDLQFVPGSSVAFYTTGGKAPVHLSGYVILEEEEGDDEEDESSDEDMKSIEVFEKDIQGECDKKAHNALTKRKKGETHEPPHKKAKTTEKLAHFANDNNHMNDDDSEEEDEGDDDSEEEGEDDDSEEEEEGDDSEEEDSSEEEQHSVFEDEMLLNEETKKEELHNTQTPGTEGPISKDDKTKKKARLAETTGESTPKSKKKAKKNVTSEAQTLRVEKPAAMSAKTPENQKNISSGAQTPKSEDKTPKKKPSKEKVDVDKNKNKSKSPLEKQPAVKKPIKVVKEGGVTCEDLAVGTGVEAKGGKMVTVYYEGRLFNNKKMFDKCDSGKGFKFRLGIKEVIRGWDVGVAGMKVGGKRRIICPPKMAYGKKRIGDIPPNSTLMFIVELKNVL